MTKEKSTAKKNNKRYIYIINFGDFYAQLTAKRIRALGGYPKIVSFNTPINNLKNPAGFIISGSPDGSIRIPVKLLTKEVFEANLPIMGICVGAHLITRYFGGNYKNLKRQAEYGIANLYIDKKYKIFKGLKKKEEVVMMHQDSISKLGKDFIKTAHTDRCRIAAVNHKKYRWYGMQFHPELSPCGDIIFYNFINLCYKDLPKIQPKRNEIKSFIKKNEKIEPSLPALENNEPSRLKKVLKLLFKKTGIKL